MSLAEFIEYISNIPREQLPKFLEDLKESRPDLGGVIDETAAKLQIDLSAEAISFAISKLPSAVLETLKGRLHPNDSPINVI